MKRPIVLYDAAVLRRKADIIKSITPDIQALAVDLIDTMKALHALGIAAPQIGSSLRMFISCVEGEDNEGGPILGEPVVFINPKLSAPSAREEIKNEGCLSLPNIRGDVARPYSILVEALDLHGHTFKKLLHGYPARVIMHENDHLNGVLFIDRVSKKTRRLLEPLCQKLKASQQV